MRREQYHGMMEPALRRRLREYAEQHKITVSAAIERAIWRLLAEQPLQAVQIGKNLIYIPLAAPDEGSADNASA